MRSEGQTLQLGRLPDKQSFGQAGSFLISCNRAVQQVFGGKEASGRAAPTRLQHRTAQPTRRSPRVAVQYLLVAQVTGAMGLRASGTLQANRWTGPGEPSSE